MPALTKGHGGSGQVQARDLTKIRHLDLDYLNRPCPKALQKSTLVVRRRVNTLLSIRVSLGSEQEGPPTLRDGWPQPGRLKFTR